jgi:hypothetical protein
MKTPSPAPEINRKGAKNRKVHEAQPPLSLRAERRVYRHSNTKR